jgi:hypothetical protein
MRLPRPSILNMVVRTYSFFKIGRSIRKESVGDAIIQIERTKDVFDFPLVVSNVVVVMPLDFDELIDGFSIGRFFPKHKIRPSTFERLKAVSEIPILNRFLDDVLTGFIEMLHLFAYSI